MIYVGTTEASRILGISAQRVKQLLYEDRIKDAVKVGRFWQIPLFNGMPKVIAASRGLIGTWRKQPLRKKTFIHINRGELEYNRIHQANHPVITVKQGAKNIYCHEVEILGGSKILYQPKLAHKYAGAVLRLEVEPNVPIKTYNFSQFPEVGVGL